MAFCIALHIGMYRHMLQIKIQGLVKTHGLAALLILNFFRIAKEFLSLPPVPGRADVTAIMHDCMEFHYSSAYWLIGCLRVL